MQVTSPGRNDGSHCIGWTLFVTFPKDLQDNSFWVSVAMISCWAVFYLGPFSLIALYHLHNQLI